jgi:hypothetical protein
MYIYTSVTKFHKLTCENLFFCIYGTTMYKICKYINLQSDFPALYTGFLSCHLLVNKISSNIMHLLSNPQLMLELFPFFHIC